jgi:hypothetical protein
MSPSLFSNFAYGSNMSVARLRVRAPSARLISTGRLPGHALTWHKVGMDGSGKCDALPTGIVDDTVWGAVFEIHEREREELNRVEDLGRGYEERRVVVQTPGGPIAAQMFSGIRTSPSVRPFEWYKRHVLTGARELGLPGEYIAAIEAVEVQEDLDLARAARESR